jgi:pimeloyl-ACP methyl ester carboxylesterase
MTVLVVGIEESRDVKLHYTDRGAGTPIVFLDLDILPADLHTPLTHLGLTDFRADIPAIDIPTLVIHGTADRVLPIDATARPLPEVNTHPRVVEVADAPHGLAWTHPDEVNDAMFGFPESRIGAKQQ